jgi:hypothetical protein
MSSNRLATAALSAAAVFGGTAAGAAEDLAALRVEGVHGQTAERARRDRYECHNWAVEQTGEAPRRAPAEPPADVERERRAERVGRVITGAVLGAGLGGVVRGAQGENPNQGVLAGAAIGAAVGAATGKAREQREEEAAAVPSDYLRALTACLEGRGYTVSMPTPDEVHASR